MQFNPDTWRPLGWRSGQATLDTVLAAALAAKGCKRRGEPLSQAQVDALADRKLLLDCYATPRWVWRLAGYICGVKAGEWVGDPFHNPWSKAAQENLAPDAWRFDGSTPDLDGLATWAGPVCPGWHTGRNLWQEDEMTLRDPDAERIEGAWRRLFGEDMPDESQALAEHDGGDVFATLYPHGRVAWSTYMGAAISSVPPLPARVDIAAPCWPGTGPILANGPHSANGKWLPLCAAAGRSRIVVAVVPLDVVRWYVEHGMTCDLEVQLGRVDYDPPPGVTLTTGNERCSSLLIWLPHTREDDKVVDAALIKIRDDRGKVRHCPLRPGLRADPYVLDFTG